MARRLRWSPRALDQVEALADYIARSSGTYPSAVVRRIFDRARGLPDQPGQGRRVPEYDGSDEIREVFVQSWRMLYRVSGTKILIVAVIHGARQIGPSEINGAT